MNYRIALPTLALSAMSFSLTAGAQSQQKKPAASTTTARPAATAPAQTATPAVTPAAKPVAASPAPEPATHAAAPNKASPEPEKKGTTPTGDRARFGIQGGMAAPMSSLGQAYTVGFAGGAFLEGRPVGFPVGIRGDLQYASFGVKNGVTSPSFTVLQLTGAAVYDFPSGNGGKSPFFASAGIGLYRNKGSGPSQTDFGQNIGLGFNLRQLPFKPFVEGRFHFYNNVQNFGFSAGFHL